MLRSASQDDIGEAARALWAAFVASRCAQWQLGGTSSNLGNWAAYTPESEPDVMIHLS